MCARLKNSYLFESLGVFFARVYQVSLTELTSALTKMAKKEKGARDSPDFIRATTSVGAILVIALGREMGDSPDFIWATTKSKCTTLVHFATQPFRSVILSAAKNLTARPFASLRVTDLLCQSFAVWFRGLPPTGQYSSVIL